MALQPGTRLGPYQIQSALGAGGMGEVYRATDINLTRQVAIKVLPDAFANDPERLARFEREAKTLASLNHPNIAQIYGLERTDGIRALVMELVEGPTLADRIAQGPIPVDEALPFAKQIAEALEAAHEQGIIHRDLKPANIKVRPDGTVKVLDFGLAKALEPTGPTAVGATASPTITSPAMTGIGMLLGTAAYMSPEQATGKPVDKRADIWAFGCVVFEMLTGKRAFQGEGISDTLASVLKDDPDWSGLSPDAPPALRALLRGCLRKELQKRLGHIAAAKALIEEIPNFAPLISPQIQRSSWDTARRILLSNAATAVAVAVISVAATWFLSRPTAPRSFRSQIITGGPAALSVAGNDTDLAITPDGSRIVYRGVNQLFVRAIDELEPKTLSGLGTPRGVFVSPDGQWIGFFDGTSPLKKVAITGGPPLTITPIDGGPRGASWGPDDSVVYASTGATGLLRVPASGGASTVLTKPDRDAGEADHFWPEFLPGGQEVLFTIIPTAGGLDNAQIAVLDLNTGEYRVVIRGGHHARYAPTGHLLYGAEGMLRAVPFNLETLEPTGTPVTVLEGVLMATSGAVDAALAQNGTLVYLPGLIGRDAARSLVWVSRDGREEPVPAPKRAYDTFQLSPDGSRLAVQTNDEGIDIWVWDFSRQTFTRLTFAPELDYDPVWTPDGRRIVFTRGSGGRASLLSRAGDGTGTEEPVATGTNMTATAFSPDGKQLVVMIDGNDLAVVSMDGSGKVTPLIQSMFTEGRAYLSPDGRWLAYQSNESGADQIYVQPFPELSGGRWQVSPGGGAEPAWSRTGRELFYIDGSGALVSVAIRTQPGFEAGAPTKLFDARYSAVSGTRRYDVRPDGQGFVFIKNPADESALALHVVTNWFEELKRLVPTN